MTSYFQSTISSASHEKEELSHGAILERGGLGHMWRLSLTVNYATYILREFTSERQRVGDGIPSSK